ncbi:unnamed protein product, partial [Owenia fusiformis]
TKMSTYSNIPRNLPITTARPPPSLQVTITDRPRGLTNENACDCWFRPNESEQRSFSFTVNGVWGSYGNFSACTTSCGEGTQSRNRYCNNPPPRNGGSDCSGSSTEVRNCPDNPLCPVDGRFGSWSNYSVCSVSCGGGIQTRTRVCIGPENGGKPCEGPTSETRECSTSPCPVDGGYGPWSDFGECSKTCGGGTQNRTRLCNNPEPANGGKDCEGPSIETRSCNENSCCPTGGGIRSCDDMPSGLYQSCESCNQYISCSDTGMRVMDCPVKDPITGERLEWDNNLKACVANSGTCTKPT